MWTLAWSRIHLADPRATFRTPDVSSAIARRQPVGMPSYLIEMFLARGATEERARRERAASKAAEALTRAGTRVHFGGSINVPDDEICFFSFDAASDREVALAAERAGLVPSRLVRVD
jgi:hypothetical protein